MAIQRISESKTTRMSLQGVASGTSSPSTTNIRISQEQLCTVCTGLDINNFFAVMYTPSREMVARDVPHRGSVRQLEAASRKGCFLCSVFITTLRPKLPNPSQDARAWTDRPVVLRGLLTRGGALYQIKVSAGDASGLCNVYPITHSPSGRAATVQIPQSMIHGRRIEEAGSAGGLDLLRDWVKQCNDTHGARCRGSGVLPTRVLNVGLARDDYIKLEIPQRGAREHYVALSHCWGRAQLIQTKVANYKQHQQRIPMTALSSTFHDAVTIARKLGIRYLWIDSLCIIQDSPSDWEAEAARMGTVYREAYLVIAAAYSDSGAGGCLRARPVPGRSFINWTLPGRGVGIVGVTPPRHDFQQLDNSPLHKRAWVLQERILAPRTIHYAEHQMLWECRTTRLTQAGVPTNLLQSSLDIWDGRLDWKAAAPKFFWDWYSMVENFSGRAITVETDRLPALSGLASVLAIHTAHDYAAGLWTVHLHWGLLWRKADTWLATPKTYRAPTWSWASVNGRVKFINSTDVNTASFRLTPDIADLYPSLTPEGKDRRGMLKAGYLSLTGHLLEIDKRTDPRSIDYKKVPGVMPSLNLTVDYISLNRRRLGIAYFDQPFRADDAQGRLFLLRVARMAHSNGAFYPTFFYGLLLRHSPTNPRQFIRVGRAEHRTWSPAEAKLSDPFASTPRTTVVIV